MQLRRVSLVPASADLLDRIIELETASYPPDEAATPEKIKFRLEHAPTLFFAAIAGEDERDVVGYVCATRMEGDKLTEEAMSEHFADGETIAIHSVVVAPDWRRRGVGTWMMNEYMRRVSVYGAVRAVLLSKPENRTLYERCGFECAGFSSVEHGSERWLELRRPLRPTGAAVPLFVVDAFAVEGKLFSGNPAAVVVLPMARRSYNAEEKKEGEEFMSGLAREMNLSETAFVQPLPDGRFSLRWFTPTREVDLCGHATLATAAALWEHHFVPEAQDVIEFVSKSGVLKARRPRDPDGPEVSDVSMRVELDFPSESVEPAPQRCEIAPGGFNPKSANVSTSVVVDAMRAAGMLGEDDDVMFVGVNRMDILVQVSPAVFEALPLHPHAAPIASLPARGLLVTTRGTTPSVAFRSRCFFPSHGILEDPVTGSAHCALCPFWESQESIAADAYGFLHAIQDSSRKGSLWVRSHTDRVLLRGDAVVNIKGSLDITPPPGLYGTHLS